MRSEIFLVVWYLSPQVVPAWPSHHHHHHPPLLLLPPLLTSSARRSAATVHDELKRDGPLKRCWNLRAGFPEAKVKTMFSSLEQARKRKQKKAGAAGVAAAGDNRVAAMGEEISDDVTATPQLACTVDLSTSLVM